MRRHTYGCLPSDKVCPLTRTTLLINQLPLLHPFNGLFSRTTWVSRYQKGKTSLDLNEARGDGVLGWQWHQLDHMQTICISLHLFYYRCTVNDLYSQSEVNVYYYVQSSFYFSLFLCLLFRFVCCSVFCALITFILYCLILVLVCRINVLIIRPPCLLVLSRER